ncbi:hypothetical protein [Rhodohalobacter sp. 8-1]|uniref:hypothetical protein n=1 Tax=Rhodohalobacter sp. 8-1 TaxID=3131972 RepID=UPI0030EF6910
MKKYLFSIASFLTLLSCSTTNQVAESQVDEIQTNDDKVVVSNIINEITIQNESVINDDSNEISISLKPIDTRKFDYSSIFGNYVGGEHRSVASSINRVSTETVNSLGNEFDELLGILDREGISYNDIRAILEIIETESDARGGSFIFTDPEIQIESDYAINENNPFSRDGRYQTIVELDIQNKSNRLKRVCEDQFIITSGATSYSNIPTNELLEDYSAGSTQYERLHTVLLNGCKIIPANSNIITHLVYPSFYENDKLVVRWIKDDSIFESELDIEKNVMTNRYYFSKVKVEDSTPGYRVLRNSATIDNSSAENSYHFIQLGTYLDYVGSEEFFIHDDIDLLSVQIFTIRKNRDETFEIGKTPITEENIRNGVIKVE